MVSFMCRAADKFGKGVTADNVSKIKFKDVSSSEYHAEAVVWAAAKGVADGYGDGSFGHDDGCQRGQGVTMLYRAHYNNLLTK
jgi:hypothetical protein